ncbi:hypothetical protein MRX96_006431 [Rhipicephalus microplus]
MSSASFILRLRSCEVFCGCAVCSVGSSLAFCQCSVVLLIAEARLWSTHGAESNVMAVQSSSNYKEFASETLSPLHLLRLRGG